MRAKPKQFIGAGYASEIAFDLPATDRARLAKHGLTEADFRWIETQMLLYNAATREAHVAPTPAEIHAAMDQGEHAIEALLHWLDNLDSETRERIDTCAAEHPKQFGAWHSLPVDLRAIPVLIELARRATPPPKAGNRPKSKKRGLTRAIADRFTDDAVAYDVLRALLPDSKDRLRELIAAARTE